MINLNAIVRRALSAFVSVVNDLQKNGPYSYLKRLDEIFANELFKISFDRDAWYYDKAKVHA